MLATKAERYLYQAVQFYDWAFLTRPLVLGNFAVTLVSVWLGARSRPGQGSAAVSIEGSGEAAQAEALWPQIAFGMLVLAIFVFALFEVAPRSFLGCIFPTVAAAIGLLMTVVAFLPLLLGRREASGNFDVEVEPRHNDLPRGAWGVLAWFLGFVGAVTFVGFIALVGFFVLFLRVVAKTSWVQTALLTDARKRAQPCLPRRIVTGPLPPAWPIR